MRELTKIINGMEYKFINDSYGNSSGFVHKTELFKNGIRIGHNKCQYYNRTWEAYTYQSVMKGLVYTLLEEIKESYKNAWKEKYGIKRLTESKKKTMMEDLENEKIADYMELKELYAML